METRREPDGKMNGAPLLAALPAINADLTTDGSLATTRLVAGHRSPPPTPTTADCRGPPRGVSRSSKSPCQLVRFDRIRFHLQSPDKRELFRGPRVPKRGFSIVWRPGGVSLESVESVLDGNRGRLVFHRFPVAAIRRSSSKKSRMKTSRSCGHSNEPSSGATATRSPSGCRSNERCPVCGPM